MADFSVILQSPQVRAVVQDNLLERAFHDALFPGMLFRGEAVPIPHPGQSGDTQIFTAPGLMAPKMKPLRPGVDPDDSTYGYEQWQMTLATYADSIPTHMPTSDVAAVDLFMRNAHQLGLSAAQSLNRIVRNRMYGAALSGWTVCDGAQTAVTTLRVKRLNGLTRARNPSLPAGSTVRFDYVSSSNPLSVTILDTGGATTRNITGYTADNPGDEVGPGTVTLSAAVTVVDRAYVKSIDATQIVRVGGGNSIDAIGSTDTVKLSDVRAVVTNFWQNNVPAHADQRFHAHTDPTNIAQFFDDPEFQRLNTSLPDYVIYRQFAVGEILNTVFFKNTECPIAQTVLPGDGVTYSEDDPFPGELYATGVATGTPIHRVLFSAQGGIMEYYQDTDAYITEAGITGKIADPRISNNGIDVVSDRIKMIIRAPLNKLQDMVSTTWRFVGDWPARTDAATGSASRYKRFQCIESGA